MAVLVLETASFTPSVAYVTDNAISWGGVPRGRGHDLLVPTIHRLTGGDYHHIDRIIVTTGPGSFTGVRSGFAAAKGFAFPRHVPILGIDLFDLTYALYRCHAVGRAPCVVALDAGRAEVFASLYTPSSTHEGGHHRDPVLNDTPASLQKIIPHSCPIVGSAASCFAHDGGTDHGRSLLPLHPTAYDLAVLHRDGGLEMGGILHKNPTPFYVRPPDISQTKK